MNKTNKTNKTQKIDDSDEYSGTYVGLRFSTDTNNKIIKFIQNKIPNPNYDIHTTILYSRKFLPEYVPLKNVNYKIEIDKFHIFEGGILVLLLKSNDLIDRHNYLMEEHKATYDYDEYIPHITLSYDIEDFCINNLDINELKDINIKTLEEYVEDLEY